MTSPQIRVPNLAAALHRPRYLISVWPWRALAYVATTAQVSGVLMFGLLAVGAPLYAAVSGFVRRGTAINPALIVFLVVATAVIVALAPVASFVVAMIERPRLILVDRQALSDSRWRGLAARYTTAEAWRETAYALWLGSLVPLLGWAMLFGVLLDFTLIASPWLAREADNVIVIWSTVDSPAEAVPYAVVGVLLLPVLGYLLGLVALLQSAVARWLLGPGTDTTALREVSRSRARLVDAYESERRRIERDVHDAAQPRLTSLTLQLGLAKLDVPDDSPAARPLGIAIEQAQGLMVLLRQIVQGIRPQSLTDLGLAGAVRELAEAASLPVTVTAELPHPVPELVETTAWYVISEALSNLRHAGATQATVQLSQVDSRLVIEISDDGHGGADAARGTGLIGLADRVAAVNGRLLLSSPAGGPTLVRVEIPWRS